MRISRMEVLHHEELKGGGLYEELQGGCVHEELQGGGPPP